MVPTRLGRPPRFVSLRIPTAGTDQVPALLSFGELVVPRKHTNIVVKYLQKQNIHLR